MKTKAFGLAARVVVCSAVIAGIAFQPGAAFAVEPAPKCESAKLNEVAKKAKCDANIASKSIKKNEPQDSTKLAKCSTKFNEKFAKSETKAEGACPSNGDASLIESTVDGCIGGVISDLGGAPQGDTEEVKCQSKKAKEAGKYAQCRFKADSKGVKKGLSPDYTKCDTKLSDKWAKIEAKPPCLTTGDLAAVKADIDACQASIGANLGGLLIEYQQDFEGLNQADPQALEFDGWLVGANVFTGPPPGGAYIGGYFAFPAPNGGPAFSAIDVGQGGPEQGAQQLSVYSDYNNAEHGNGNTIEAFVFHERTIVAADIGRTLTLQFDAKIGNLELLSTAAAYIKTIDPGAGFATTNLVEVDMTAIPAAWGTYSVSLDLTDPLLENQLVQFGFTNKATMYQGSGVFYDNIVASTLPTP